MCNSLCVLISIAYVVSFACDTLINCGAEDLSTKVMAALFQTQVLEPRNGLVGRQKRQFHFAFMGFAHTQQPGN